MNNGDPAPRSTRCKNWTPHPPHDAGPFLSCPRVDQPSADALPNVPDAEPKPEQEIEPAR